MCTTHCCASLRVKKKNCIKTNKEAHLAGVSTACHAVFATGLGATLVVAPICWCVSVGPLRRRLPSHLTKLIELR